MRLIPVSFRFRVRRIWFIFWQLWSTDNSKWMVGPCRTCILCQHLRDSCQYISDTPKVCPILRTQKFACWSCIHFWKLMQIACCGYVHFQKVIETMYWVPGILHYLKWQTSFGTKMTNFFWNIYVSMSYFFIVCRVHCVISLCPYLCFITWKKATYRIIEICKELPHLWKYGASCGYTHLWTIPAQCMFDEWNFQREKWRRALSSTIAS